MGFFSDLKEDLSQAVNELMPEEEVKAPEKEQEAEAEVTEEEVEEAQAEDALDLEKMLENLDTAQWAETAEGQPVADEVSEAGEEQAEVAEVEVQEEEAVEAEEAEPEYDLESMLASALAADAVYTEEKTEENKGAERKMDSYASRVVSDETSIITAGMTIAGDITSEGSVDLIGSVNGNIDIFGKLNITGHITGNSKASEIFAEGAKINGEVVSEGAVKIGASSVVIGNIIATSAAIAGAVKGDIDVKGPVVLDSSAIVMGNIKSKSVQINNGAVIEGMCSQCYADVSPTAFFDDYKPEIKKSKK